MIDGLKPYPKSKKSGALWLPEIPATWDMRRNGRLFVERNETNAGELPILEVSLRTGVRVRNFDAGSRKQVMEDREKYKRARKGDLAYNMMRMWQGAVGVVPTDGLVSPAYVVARPLPGVLPAYFEYLFRTDAYKRQVNDYSRGIVADRNRLYWDSFKQIPTPFPPPEEQAAIVRFLDHADRQINRYIRAKRKLIALLNEQKQAIIHRAVTRGLDPNVKFKPTGVEWLGDVPDYWEVCKIGFFAKVGNGSTPSRSNSAYWSGGTFPWLNSSSVNRGSIRDADQFVTAVALRECHLPKVPPGSVLIAITGQGKTRGTAAVLRIEATINQHIAYVVPHGERINPEYLQQVFVAAYNELRRISSDSGSTKGALTCADVANFKVPLPPNCEQFDIVAAVNKSTASLEAACQMAQREIDLFQEYRTRLVTDLVTGKIDVRDAAAKLPDLTDNQDADPAEDEEFEDDEVSPDDDAIAEAAE